MIGQDCYLSFINFYVCAQRGRNSWVGKLKKWYKYKILSGYGHKFGYFSGRGPSKYL